MEEMQVALPERVHTQPAGSNPWPPSTVGWGHPPECQSRGVSVMWASSRPDP